MKKLLLSIAIIIASLSVSAQTVGLIIQPDVKNDIARKGIFVQVDVYDKIGVYSDIKYYNDKASTFNTDVSALQVNAGITLKLTDNLRSVTSISAINTETTKYYNVETKDISFINKSIKVDPAFQIGLMYSEGRISVLGGYEFQQDADATRLTIGFGFNF